MNIDIKKLKPTEVAAYARIVTDVRLWAEAFLMNPDNEQPFRLNHVQHQMLKPGKIKKVIRIHRRGGKSYGLAILALWYALTHQSGQVLIICPDMGKVQTIMRSIDEFLRVSTFIAGELKSATKIPAIREFRNGSTIKGFTTGSSSKTQGKSIRGSTADLVIIDEAAFLNDDDWPAIEPIIQGDSTRPEVITYISSTPTADRNRYWEYCTQPQYEEVFDRVHVPVTENPDYTPDRIAVVKASTNDFTFKQEWMAAFPDIGEGVYKRSYIDRAQREFEYYDPKLPKSIPYPAVRTMGVDWDKYNGTGPNIYILELDRDNQRVKGVYHEEIDPGEYCLTLAVSRIIELNTIFNPQHIFVDRGFGECVAPNTLITTNRGLIPISEVVVGDKVLTVEGKYDKVLNTVTKQEPKDTYKVKISHCLPVEVSSTHPFYVMDKEGNKSWKNITELHVGDFVATPKLKTKEASKYIIDALNILPKGEYSFDDAYIWANNQNGSDGTKINRFYDLLSNEFLTFAGWYISEGSSSKSVVEITQAYEGGLVPEIIECISTTFGSQPKVYVKVDTRKKSYKELARVCICSTIATKLMKVLFGESALTKKIPIELLPYAKQLGPLLRSLLKGDGHLGHSKRDDTYCYELGLISPTVIDQVRLIITTATNVVPAFYKEAFRSDVAQTRYKLICSGNPDEVDILNNFLQVNIPNRSRVSRKCSKITDKHVFLPIRKIEYIGEVSGLVDIEVENGHSFVGNGIVLHNSQVETLHLYGIQHPESGLASKVRGVSFSETVDVIDPITKEHIKKRIKPVMVNITVKWMEDGRFNYPRSHQRFTNQLQDFKIVSITDTAIKYSSEDEHIIDAFMLAAYALYENYEDPFGIDPAINSYLLPVPEYVTETVAKSQAYGYTSDPSPIQKDFSRRKVPKIVYNNTDSNSGLAARRTF